MKICRACQNTDHQHFFEADLRDTRTRILCRACVAKRSVARYRANKLAAIEYKGGKCEMCGYNECQAALVFHHRTPSEKDPDWHKLRGKNLNSIKEELDKCALLCCNCHAEVHYCEPCNLID